MDSFRFITPISIINSRHNFTLSSGNRCAHWCRRNRFKVAKLRFCWGCNHTEFSIGVILMRQSHVYLYIGSTNASWNFTHTLPTQLFIIIAFPRYYFRFENGNIRASILRLRNIFHLNILLTALTCSDLGLRCIDGQNYFASLQLAYNRDFHAISFHTILSHFQPQSFSHKRL
jgi:hypothetical protein